MLSREFSAYMFPAYEIKGGLPYFTSRTIVDAYYRNLKTYVIFGKIWGVLHFQRNSNGTYVTKLVSPSTLYFLCFYLVLSYLWCQTLSEMLKEMRIKIVKGSYVMMVVLSFHFLPIAVVLESRKISEYFTAWMKFQVKFFRVTGAALDLRCKKLTTFLWVTEFTMYITGAIFISHQFPDRSLAAHVLVTYYYWLSMFLVSFWYLNIQCLYQAVTHIQRLVRRVATNATTKMRIVDIHFLWIDVCRLATMMGQSGAFSYSVLILIHFVESTVATYECLTSLHYPLTDGIFALVALVLTGLARLWSIPFTAQLAVKEMSENMYRLLIDLKIKGSAPRWVKEIDEMLQAISDNKPRIDLGGFVTLDNGLITSLMGTMVTYLIVLVQFRV